MKKLFAILAVLAIVIACNDNSGSEKPTDDSTRLPSTVSPSDTSTIPVDTPPRAADTVLKK